MDQTPVHEHHNAGLLALIPADCRKIVEVGCSSGALAREYKKLNAGCHYLGIEIDPDFAQLARRHCDEVLNLDIETASEASMAVLSGADCWVFGDTLEHLRDPWSVLKHLHTNLAPDGSIVACIPNAQHWSVQARLSCGLFRYEDSGLLDRTHLRWFTRITIHELFAAAGFKVVVIRPRIFPKPQQEKFLAAIRTLAQAAGADPERAAADALATQYLIQAVRA